MTIDELKECYGFTVQVGLDGGEALGRLIERDGSPMLEWPPPLSGEWDTVTVVPLTEEDIHALNRNGEGNLYSKIRLTSEGGKRRIE
ncbi:hypothetical protein OAK81_00345 [Verrucomicrobiales bacterium]|nr:hypothetical protein [Verrucomicrobiales bacterium]MDC0291724.1 hypothetical protein [Verrucomicrobiales bacterium]